MEVGHARRPTRPGAGLVMNAPIQTYTDVTPERLLEAARGQQLSGSRLVQICCTRLEHFELLYSFSRPDAFEHLRLRIPDASVKVPSISPIYSASFAYENEIHDLFGLSFIGLNIDYQGNFFKTSVFAPMAAREISTEAKTPK